MTQRERILLVDDSATVRKALQLLLEREGYTIETATTAEAARQLVATKAYDLAIVDKNLPDEDGFSFCRHVGRRAPSTARVMMTGDQSVESAIRAMEEDIYGYLTKPLQPQVVLLRVRRALDRVALLRERAEAQRQLQVAKDQLESHAHKLELALEQLVRTQARLAESDKLVSLGVLAAGVAHEINNPACFILPNLEYLKRGARKLAGLAENSSSDPQRVAEELHHSERMIDRCLEGLQRIQKVVETLQLFSRRDRQEPKDVELNRLIGSVLDLVSHELDGSGRLEVALEPVAPVRGQEEELAQAVLNLLLNARRSIGASQDGRQSIRLSTSMEDGRVRLAVRDSGPPLAPDSSDPRGSALDPFYEALSSEDGPGLGLSLARDIIDRHGGELRLTSDEDGNLLEAFLPGASRAVASDCRPDAARALTASQRNGT